MTEEVNNDSQQRRHLSVRVQEADFDVAEELKALRELSPGRSSFYNQLIAAFMGWKDTRNDPSKAITLGDGTPLDRDAVMTACRIADELTFDVPWQPGDVVGTGPSFCGNAGRCKSGAGPSVVARSCSDRVEGDSPRREAQLFP